MGHNFDLLPVFWTSDFESFFETSSRGRADAMGEWSLPLRPDLAILPYIDIYIPVPVLARTGKLGSALQYN